MGMIIRLHNIVTTNSFRLFIKEGDTPYPLNVGYTQYNGIYPPTTNEIDIDLNTLKFNTKYWIKLVDIITGRYIIENIVLNDDIAYVNCDESCEFDGIAKIFAPTPTPTITPTITPTPSTTPPSSNDCDSFVQYTEGTGTHSIVVSFPDESYGEIKFTYSAINIPDRFRVVYDGEEIINTGFVSNYYGDTDMMNMYEQQLIDAGIPPEEAIITGPAGYITFNKTTPTNFATVYVDAPLVDTAWNFLMSCGDIIYPTPTQTPTRVTPTPTPTVTPSKPLPKITWVLITLNGARDAGKIVQNIGIKNNQGYGLWDSSNPTLESDGVSLFSNRWCSFPDACFGVTGTDWYMSLKYNLGTGYDKPFKHDLGDTGRILITKTFYSESQITEIINNSTEITNWTTDSNTGTWDGYFDMTGVDAYTYVYWIVDYRATEPVVPPSGVETLFIHIPNININT